MLLDNLDPSLSDRRFADNNVNLERLKIVVRLIARFTNYLLD